MTTVRLLLPQGAPRRWHAGLAESLAADGAQVLVSMRPGPPLACGLALVEQIEGLLYDRGGSSACDVTDVGLRAWTSDAQADLEFDLTGVAAPAAGAIFPLYDGSPGEDARDSALLDRRMPRLQLARATEGGFTILAEGVPANERPWLLRAGREAVATRLTTLARACVRTSGRTLSTARAAPVVRRRRPELFLGGALAARVRARLGRLLAHEGHWRIGWRACAAGDGVLDRLEWPQAAWTWLPDDRRRYFADPFLFDHGGQVFVFCEEFPYSTAKAVISVFTLDAQGRPTPPRVVLERPYHLSYPLVFRHDGQIWMMPESSTRRTLELYRADPFPDRWVLDRILLEGLEISDATPFEAGGRHFLTAATSDDGGSSWDCLSLFSGPGPLGPWTRCGDGPALVDASAARPAGRIEKRGDRLWRPAQDCTAGYGSGLALCRIERAGEGDFSQTVAARLRPPSGAPPEGVHTLNSGAGFETIDAVGPRGRWKMPGQGDES